tara:strand:+ start:459 stop:1352 length:894 start_codon:yes stop_codon:yes gene_type:complete
MNKSVILLYHGVTNIEPNGIENVSGKHIQGIEFERQMRFLGETQNVVNLRDVKNIKGSVAVTFDDAFKNVRDLALPILKKYNIPATFFITTGFVNTNNIFWVDTLEHAINFSSNDTIFFNTKIYKISTDNQKIKFMQIVKSELKKSKPKYRDWIIEHITNQTGWSDENLSKNYEMLNWEDVRALDDLPNYEVGGHSVNHEILSYLDEETLDFEIKKCIKDLEDKLDRNITSFSYPEGQREHYNDSVISVLKKNGIDICPSAISGYVEEDDNNFNLKRIMVGFWQQRFPFEEYYEKYD